MKEKKKSQLHKKWYFWVGIVFLLIAAGFIGESKSQKEKAAVEAEKNMPLDKKIEKAVNKKLGEETNHDKKRIVELKVNDHAGTTDNKEDKIVLLTLMGDEALSKGTAKDGILFKSSDVFKEVFKNKEVEEVALSWKMTLVDKYGKESDADVSRISLKRDTFEKIEWENFNIDNFESVADDFYLHPALK